MPVSSPAIPVTRTTTPRFSEQLRDSAAFGAVFSDHVLVADYVDGHWGEPVIVPYGQMHLPPAPLVAHYGQGIFEGFKAFPRDGGGAALFRPDANHARMNRTCERMAMPEIPASIFIEGTRGAGRRGSAVDSRQARQRALHPAGDVRASASRSASVRRRRYRFIIETCPERTVLSPATSICSRRKPTCGRFPGGTGAAKCAGNYAGSLVAAREAQAKGFHNVLWLDGIERRYVEEAGLMNVVFVIDGTVVTPPLTGTILPGITRDSVLTLLREMGVPVAERRITIDEVFEAHAAGRLQGAAGVGTAATIAPLGRLRHKDREITVPSMTPDSALARVGAELDAIRTGQSTRPSRVDDGGLGDREIWGSCEVVIWRSESDDVSIW